MKRRQTKGRPMGGMAKKPKKGGKEERDEEIVEDELLLSDEEEAAEQRAAPEEEKDPYEDETADEKRLRLAQEYLAKIEKETKARGGADDDEDEDEDETERMTKRLNDDLLRERGKLVRDLAERVKQRWEGGETPGPVRLLRGHRLPLTCSALSDDDTMAVSGAKDGTIIRWDVETGGKVVTLKTEENRALGNQILSVAVSGSDPRLIASGGEDRQVRLWDTRTNQCVHSYSKHKAAVTCLAFRRHSGHLYSGSYDRVVNVYNTDDRLYVDSLFGHQSEITCMDALMAERVLTCGADRTVRLWKVPEESQLVHRAHTASIDAVCFITDQTYLAGSQDGAISLWSAARKKPTAIMPQAHNGRWITSVAALPFSDVCATGSSDGFLRMWHLEKGGRASSLITVPITGFINSMHIANSGRFIIAGVGQEHRLGRWEKMKPARNGLHIVPLL